MTIFKTIAELNKIKITIAVTITTVAGYILMKHQIDTGIILPALGIFILACGSSVINQYQERSLDALMQRTKNRPIPSGRISAKSSLTIGIFEIIAGSVILYFGSGNIGLILGWLALIWYNVIYTNLKKVTAQAVIPGAIIGSIPPLVGWVAAGGTLLDIKALIIALFFFIWQVPHFMLLALKYSEDYNRAGLPNISQKMTLKRTRTSIFFWILATVLTSILFPVTGIVESILSIVGLLIISIIIVVIYLKVLDNRQIFNPIAYFKYINYYVLTVVILLCTDQFIR